MANDPSCAIFVFTTKKYCECYKVLGEKSGSERRV